MSKLISKLPKRIRDRALECQKKDKHLLNRETDELELAFRFAATKEGLNVWFDVSRKKYSSFYTFHNIKPHGGKRANAGRPLKYGEETTEVTYYPPLSKKHIIDKMVKEKLKEWVVKK